MPDPINTTEELAPETIESIRRAIATELKKRGFHAAINITIRKDIGVKNWLLLDSEEFNTVPVIMESLKLYSYGDFTANKERGNSYINVGLRIEVNYKHFGGGSNGCELFRFYCEVAPDNWDIFNVVVR